MKPILDKKVTGSIYKGLTWREFSDKVITDLLINYFRPLEYKYMPDAIFDTEIKSFGIGDEYWGVTNNLEELKNNFIKMDKNSFSIYVDKCRTKLPPQVIELIVSKIEPSIFKLTRQ